MASLRINEVTFHHWRLDPAASRESTQLGLYLIVRGRCIVSGTAVPSLVLAPGTLGVFTATPHNVTAGGSSDSDPSALLGAELFSFQFDYCGEAFPETVPKGFAHCFCTSTSSAASWFWRIAPLLMSSADCRQPHPDTYARLAEAILSQAIHEFTSAPDGKSFGGHGDIDVARIERLLRDHPERKWTIDVLAREVSMSRSSLADRFVHALGRPPMEYLSHLRMERAAMLLDQPDVEFKRIAAAVGYRSLAAFGHAFRRWSGSSPNAYRRRGATTDAGERA